MDVDEAFGTGPAAKHAVATYARDPRWRGVRPPRVELDEVDAREVDEELEAIDFDMPDDPEG